MRKRVENVAAKVHKFTNFIACVILFFQSTPNLWAGFMTLPLVFILVILFSGVPSTYPLFQYVLDVGFPFICLGLIVLIWSVTHYVRHRKDGIVTSGPYRLMRHPQYFGSLLFSLGLTQSCIKILKLTFGMGWLTTDMTMLAWFFTFLAYIFLASAEEYYLTRKMGEKYLEYIAATPFLFPFFNLRKRGVEILICLAILATPLIYIYFHLEWSDLITEIEVGCIVFLMIIFYFYRTTKHHVEIR